MVAVSVSSVPGEVGISFRAADKERELIVEGHWREVGSCGGWALSDEEVSRVGKERSSHGELHYGIYTLQLSSPPPCLLTT